ncbi:unnamed protein product, partial [Phaeothamnion confervicola]
RAFVAASFLKEPAPGKGPLGQWYVRDDPTVSVALPWISKPDIAGGSLVGDNGFDPLGLAKTFDISWMRAAELKHGRVCMLAAVGLLAPELVQHPAGFEGFHFAPEFTEMNTIAALAAVPKFGLAQIVLACGLIEIATFGSNYNSAYSFDDNLSKLERDSIAKNQRVFLTGAAKTTNDVNPFGSAENVGFMVGEGKTPGDLGFDPLGFAASGVKPEYAESEIKHARLAMIGVAGMLAQQFYASSGTGGILEQT